MSHNLNSLKWVNGIIQGTTIGDVKRNSRSLDSSLYEQAPSSPNLRFQRTTAKIKNPNYTQSLGRTIGLLNRNPVGSL